MPPTGFVSLNIEPVCFRIPELLAPAPFSDQVAKAWRISFQELLAQSGDFGLNMYQAAHTPEAVSLLSARQFPASSNRANRQAR